MPGPYRDTKEQVNSMGKRVGRDESLPYKRLKS